MVKEKIPMNTLKVVPNIKSQKKLFRSKTTAITDILQISGFIWNYESCTIECGKNAYNEYVKVYIILFGNYATSCIWYLYY